MRYRDETLTPKQRMSNFGTFGFGFEDEFEEMVRESGFNIERGDSDDLRNPDYNIELRVDTKVRKTPFFKSEQFIGIPPDKCIVIDMDKIRSYISDGKNALIICKVDYRPHFNTLGTYMITTNEIKNLITKYPNRLSVFRDYEKSKDIERFYMSISEMKHFARISFLFE